MRFALLLVLPALAAAAPAMAQQVETSLYAQIGSEWFSERSDGADPTEGLRLTHRYGGEIEAGNDAFQLRGSFGLAQGVVLAGDGRESLSADVGVEAEVALSPNLTATAGFSADWTDRTGSARVLGLRFPTRGDTLELAGEVSLVYRNLNTAVAVEAGIVADRVGHTSFSGIGLIPRRLDADVDTQYLAFDIEQRISPTFTIIASAEAARLAVNAGDSARFDRLPAERLRAAAGLRLAPSDTLTLEFAAGADLLTSAGLDEDAIVRPYGYGSLGIGLRDGVQLTLSADIGTGFDDPRDGFADWTWRLDAEGSWQIDRRLTLVAGGYAEGGTQVLSAIELPFEAGLEAGFRYSIASDLTLSATAGLSRETLLGVSTDAVTLALTLRATL